jgi:hypothetical protein
VSYFGGHSSPIGLVFENASDKSQSSWLGLVMLGGKNSPIGIDTVSLKEMPDDAFRDVFLVILAGCRAGNPVYAPQLRLRNLGRKMDPKQVNGVLTPDTQQAIDSYQRWKELPRTRNIDAALLLALGLDPAAPPAAATTIRSVQASLSILSDMLQPDLDNKGEPTGVWGVGSTLAAITYQNNMNLEPTGICDQPTLHKMGMGAEDRYQESVAQTILDKGAEVVVAFDDYTQFGAMERWSEHFWQLLSEGVSIGDADKRARALVTLGPKERLPAPRIVPEQAGSLSLLPARYGRTLSP